MRKQSSQLIDRVRSVARPPAIIFGVALLHFVVTYVWVMRWRQEYGRGPYASGWDPSALLAEPFLLLVSAAMLLPGAWWGRLISLAVSLWLLYFLGYSGLLAVSYAHDIPLLSLETGRRWFQMTRQMQSQVFAQLALAGAITIYVLASFYGIWRRRR
jgi:hypothetical protein